MTVQTISGACSVQIYSQSAIQMFMEFSSDIHSDFGSQQPYVQASMYFLEHNEP